MELIIIIAAAGAVGGLIKSLAEQKGAVALPCIETAKDGTKYVHLGGISNLVIGAAIAAVIATTPTTAVVAGISSAFIAEKLLERAKDLPFPIPGIGKGN
ncbi:MAG: hypothetical protein WA130_17550 [Candidatus Methanoperedens sp.]